MNLKTVFRGLVTPVLFSMAAFLWATPAFASGGVTGEISPFIYLVSIFVMAVFVGYFVVWSVTPGFTHPLDGGDQRDFFGDCCRCFARRWGECPCGHGECWDFWISGSCDGVDQYFWRFSRHPAHARHVQEKGQITWRLQCQRLGQKLAFPWSGCFPFLSYLS